jgi:hypothetical protein
MYHSTWLQTMYYRAIVTETAWHLVQKHQRPIGEKMVPLTHSAGESGYPAGEV